MKRSLLNLVLVVATIGTLKAQWDLNYENTTTATSQEKPNTLFEDASGNYWDVTNLAIPGYGAFWLHGVNNTGTTIQSNEYYTNGGIYDHKMYGALSDGSGNKQIAGGLRLPPSPTYDIHLVTINGSGAVVGSKGIWLGTADEHDIVIDLLDIPGSPNQYLGIAVHGDYRCGNLQPAVIRYDQNRNIVYAGIYQAPYNTTPTDAVMNGTNAVVVGLNGNQELFSMEIDPATGNLTGPVIIYSGLGAAYSDPVITYNGTEYSVSYRVHTGGDSFGIVVLRLNPARGATWARIYPLDATPFHIVENGGGIQVTYNTFFGFEPGILHLTGLGAVTSVYNYNTSRMPRTGHACIISGMGDWIIGMHSGGEGLHLIQDNGGNPGCTTTVSTTADVIVPTLSPSTWPLNQYYQEFNTTITQVVRNGDVFDCSGTLITSFEPEASVGMAASEQMNDVQVYPSISSGIYNLEFGDITPQSLQLLSIDGQLMQQWDEVSTQLNLTTHSSGMYLLRLQAKEGVKTMRITKR